MKFNPKPIRVLALSVFTGLIFSCAGVSPAARNAKYQEEREYPFWLRDQMTLWQKMFGEDAGKDPRIKQAEKELESNKRMLREQEKEQEVLEKVKEIKSKIKQQ